MNNSKVLVEIFVPAAEHTFDAFIPLESKVGEITNLVATAVADLSKGKYKSTSEAALCDAATGIIYDVNMEAAELGIKNGARLMLI